MMNHSIGPEYIFVGLGNPGPQYEMTRHNIGALVLKEYARRMGWRFKEEGRFKALIAGGVVDNKKIRLLLPTTYMNLSGVAVREYLNFLKIESEKIVVIVDDIALPFGELRFRTAGSAGGHNGLKSIQAHLGTDQYKRLRMGVGHPGDQILADYVLSPFNKEEMEQLASFIDKGIEFLQNLLNNNESHSIL